MKIDFYAVGWQPARGKQQVGQVKDFRKGIFNDSGLNDFVSHLSFGNEFNINEENLIDKFKIAITSLDNVETNGNNTEVPFYRRVSKELTNEFNRCEIITQELNQELPPLQDFNHIRFYILVIENSNNFYRFYIKALRTTKLKTRFVLTLFNKSIKIVDTENDGKALSYTICYAETLSNNFITQYVFNIQDYEDIFGLNESKIRLAKSNLKKFIKSTDTNDNYKISKKYLVKISNDEELNEIYSKISSNRKLANLLSKYNGEAENYPWDDVKKANELSKKFLQTPFEIDEDANSIILTSDSLDAFVSVISNTKKLGISKNEYEDSLASKRTRK